MSKIDLFKDQVSYGSRLQLTWPLSDITSLRPAIREVLTKFPDLQCREYDRRHDTYVVKRKRKPRSDLGKVLTVGTDDIMLIAVGGIEWKIWDRLHQAVHEILVGKSKLAPVDMQSYDIRCGIEFLSGRNFYEVLMRTLFQGRLMEEMMEGKLLYEFDPLLRFVWPANSHTKYGLDFTGNQEYADVIGNLPQEEGRLLVTLSREMDEEDFEAADSMMDLIVESRTQLLEAIEGFLIPKIIEPIKYALEG